MSDNVVFHDNSIQVIDALKDAAIAFLYEAGDEIIAQTARNYDLADRVDTGHTKGSFDKVINESELSCTIGSSYENAIWEEYGTGIYAENGNGRKTPWRYKTKDDHWVTTKGKKGHKPFFKAYNSRKDVIKREAEKRFQQL